MKKFSIVSFSMGNRLFMLVFPCCNLVCAFAAVFSEKSQILGAKLAKLSILAFSSALDFSHKSCKNIWKAA